MTKRTGRINPTYRLTTEDRDEIRVMLEIAKITRRPMRWSKTAIGDAYGVTRKTVYDIEQGKR